MGPGVGKFLFRIRQAHIAERYGPLIAKKAFGAVKLDIVLRSIALLPEHAGKRAAGFVLWSWRFEHLHDLAREPPSELLPGRTDRATRHLKRKWVGEQLEKLEDLKLVKIKQRPGDRPELLVRRDDGRGGPFDDPGASGGFDDDRYVTIRGSLIASGTFASWNAPEVAAYLAAIYAETHNDRGVGRPIKTDGTGTWWRQLAWFSDTNMFPSFRDPLTFSKSLLEDGLAAHQRAGLITVSKIDHNPITNRLFETKRNYYRNRFDKFDSEVKRVSPSNYDAATADSPPNGSAANPNA